MGYLVVCDRLAAATTIPTVYLQVTTRHRGISEHTMVNANEPRLTIHYLGTLWPSGMSQSCGVISNRRWTWFPRKNSE